MARQGLDAKFDGQVFRKDHPMVISSNRHLATILPVRLAYNAAGYLAGQVLSRDTADGLFKKHSAVSGGSFDSTCVLFEDVGGTESSGTALARGIQGGEVFKTALLDYNASAKTAMGARDITDASGVSIVKF